MWTSCASGSRRSKRGSPRPLSRPAATAADVRVLVATKYVAAEHLGALRDAGIRLIGENRAQDLVAKHELYGDAFDYHFIGHLQSRKTRQVLPIVSLIHSVSQHERRAGDRGPRRERHRRAAGGQHR